MKLQELKIGQTVFTTTKGQGIVVEIVDENDVKVDFGGKISRCLALTLKLGKSSKVKKYMTEVEEVDEKVTFQTIVNELSGANRTSTLFFSPEKRSRSGTRGTLRSQCATPHQPHAGRC